MKTTAAVLTQINKPLITEELDTPSLQEGQVLVAIAYSGICHSQLNEIRGLKGEDRFLPHTLGHEGSGVVEAVGPGVTKVKPHDRVVLTWIKGSGLDASSPVYLRSDGTRVNSGAISTFLSRAVISENRLVKIPDALSLKSAALLGCAVPTGAGIVLHAMDVSGKSIAIFGMGGIGLSALLAAKIKGAAKIIAVDVSGERLQKAGELGATHLVNAKDAAVVAQILTITGIQGVDYAIESAGSKEAMESAFQSVRDKGGLCVIAGNLSSGKTMQIDPFDLIKGKRIVGTWGGQTQPDTDIPLYAEWALKGRLNLEKLICREFELEEINEAMEYMDRNAVGRVLLRMGIK